MAALKIDNKPVRIVKAGWVEEGNYRTYRIYVAPRDSIGGAHSQHDIPSCTGKFFTNGHSYEWF